VLQCAAIQFQFQLREEEEEVVVVVVVVVVQGAELGCLLRRLMVQASAEYKKDGLTAPSFLYLLLSGVSLFPGRPVPGVRLACRSEPGD